MCKKFSKKLLDSFCSAKGTIEECIENEKAFFINKSLFQIFKRDDNRFELNINHTDNIEDKVEEFIEGVAFVDFLQFLKSIGMRKSELDSMDLICKIDVISEHFEIPLSDVTVTGASMDFVIAIMEMEANKNEKTGC